MIDDSEHRDSLDKEVVTALRAMTGAERLRVASGMYSAARRMLRSHLGHRHPDWSADEVQQQVARRLSRGAG